MSINRRDFLAAIGGAAAGYGVSKIPLTALVDIAGGDYSSVPAVERWVTTSCQICPSGCGMIVRKVDGNPVGIKGNPLHPLSRGGLCPVGSEALHLLYSPDRHRAPMQRVGGTRGKEGKWKKVGWDAGLDLLKQKIRALVENGEADRIYFLDGYDRGMLSETARAFMAQIGSSNYFLDRDSNQALTSYRLTQGQKRVPAYDFDNTRFLLSFGVPFLEGWQSPMQGQRAIGTIRSASSNDDPRTFVHVDTRSSKTSDLADRFLRIKPGSHGALALALAYVLIRYELYNQAFVSEHCSGFEDWTDDEGVQHQGFKSYVLLHCRPEDLQEVTGVSGADVVELARDFAASQPALAVADGVSLALSNGVQTGMAVMALNALVGSIDVAGGVRPAEQVPHPAYPWAEDGKENPGDPVAGNGLFHFGIQDAQALVRTVSESKKKIGVLLCLHSNPFFPRENSDQFRDLLDDKSMVVSFSPYPDETSTHADLILPDHSFLERWQDAVGPRTYPYATMGITRPVMDPLYDTKDSFEIVLDLARSLAPKGGDLFPWKKSKDVLLWLAGGLHELKRGSVFTNEREANEIAKMEQRGWWVRSYPDQSDFWSELLDRGGWWDPGLSHGLWGSLFRTPSHRYEFFSRGLHDWLANQDPENHVGAHGAILLGLRSKGDVAFLPHFEAPDYEGEEGEESLLLHVVHPITPNTAVAASLPWVREVISGRLAWETWVEIHPADARHRSIHDQGLVWIHSGDRKVVARARVTNRVQEGLVCVPHGLGRPAGGRWARSRGTNPDSLVQRRLNPLSGMQETQSLRVLITTADQGVTHA